MRKKKTEIKGLYNADGVWVDNDRDMNIIANDYFSNLFKSSDPTKSIIAKVVDDIKPQISEVQNVWLEKDFSRDVLKSMNPSKAPGPAGPRLCSFKSIEMWWGTTLPGLPQCSKTMM